MASFIPQTLGYTGQVWRVGGGYTSITFAGQQLLYIDTFREVSQRPVQNPEPVQPMDSPYPVDIAFPIALQAGTLELTFREQWSTEIWELLPGYQGIPDLLGVFKQNLANGAITVNKVITGPNNQYRAIIYLHCAIVSMNVDETINVGTMTLPKTITLMYTQRVRSGGAFGSTPTSQGSPNLTSSSPLPFF